MPVSVTYPGVYVEELPSGQHSIAGVPTSIAAFLGRAPFGPIDAPVTIQDYGDFERAFGGLMADYPMSYAVRDFFLNGGAQAVIVRLFEPKPKDATRGVATLKLSHIVSPKTKGAKPAPVPDDRLLTLVAANPGAWGDGLQAKVDHDGITARVAKVYGQYDLTAADLFNLTLTRKQRNGELVTERYANVTLHKGDAPNRLDRVLAHQSTLARVANDDDGKPLLPAQRPPDGANGKGSGGNDGRLLQPASYLGDEAAKTGLYLLDKTDIFNLLCLPADVRGGDMDATVYTEAAAYCVKRRAFLIVDPPVAWKEHAEQGEWSHLRPDDPAIGIVGEHARNAALYFPRVTQEDVEKNDTTDVFPACGIIAGIYATTDVNRGVWKAPAGQEAALAGIQGLEVALTDAENGLLNPVGINCLRNFPVIGPVIWGARTLRGADQLADDFKYVNVRRLTLYIEESLYRGTQWAVFEPNDESLWASLRVSVSGFMSELERQGAFYQYNVVCDNTTTTARDIEQGIVNVVVAFAPVRPAEFIVLQIQLQTQST